jgi:hypothetical protein
MLPIAAVIEIERSVAVVTVSAMLLEVTPFCVAEMLLEPMAAPLAKPLVLIVATAVFEVLQVAEPVRFCVLPSLNVPVAVN